MKKFIVIALFVFGVSIFFNSFFVKNADATVVITDLEWKETNSVAGECYLEDGKNDDEHIRQDFLVTETCSEKNGGKDVCTLNATRQTTETKNHCETSKAYCHATSAGEVNPYNYLFNTAWVQHLQNNGTPQAGHERDYFTWEGDRDCVGYRKVCTDPEATNYDNELDDSEISDNSLCEYDNSNPTPTPTPTGGSDVCMNIDGIQTGVPEGQHLDASGLNCVNFELGGAPVSEGTPSNPQVLGASTMAGTGVAEENLFNLIFALGSLLSAFGIRKFSSSRVK